MARSESCRLKTGIANAVILGDPSPMESQIQSLALSAESGEQSPLVVEGYDWDHYLSTEELFSERGVRVRLLDNRIEIIAPVSEAHEHRKSNLGCLIEAWFLAKNVRFFIRGNMTMRKEGEASGEADESYCFGEKKEISDLVIEVALTSGGFSKREFYSKFPVPELWIWRNESLEVHLWNADGESYEQSSESGQLPGIDIQIVEECAVIEYASDAILEFKKRCGL